MITRNFFYIFKRHLRHIYHSITVVMLVLSVAACERAPLPFPPIKPISKLIVLTPTGPLSYEPPSSAEKKGSGLSHDLVTEFAKTLNLEADFLIASPSTIIEKLQQHQAHFAIGWIDATGQPDLIAGSKITETYDILVQNQNAPAVRSKQALSGKTVFALKSSHAATLSQPKPSATEEESLGFKIEIFEDGDAFQLLEKVANQEIEFALIDKATYSIALNYFPNLDSNLKVSKPYPISWLFPSGTSPQLIAKASDFIYNSHEDGSIRRLLDRYLGHVERLNQTNSSMFIEKIQSALPALRPHFISAQEQTGIDWRLIAAIAYRESGWDPLATSYTNVRGIMMLTEDTASRMGVKDRLDPRQSILAGARYLQMLRRKLPNSTPEPDRTWQALAAYNLGPTNFELGRQFAKQNNFDPNSWYDMKKALPRFSRISTARGGEAVIMVESVRLLYDTLKRYEQPHISRHAKSKPNKQKTLQ
jgi:membrane-bound lytic murein transglycosylase F